MVTGRQVATPICKRFTSPTVRSIELTISSRPNQNNNQTQTSGQGFPQAGLDAQNNGGLTKANTPTTANSLGLDIE